jgi:hypothetical protein
VSRYYYQQGALELAARHDLEVKRAAEILQNEEQYKDFLQKK